MAIIKVTTTGSGLKGSVGDVYYKVQNGKQIVCSKPSHYTLPQDEGSVMHRNNMKLLSYISKKVTQVPLFYDMWFRDELKGIGPYHKFLGFNHPKKNPLDYTKIKLTPSSEILAEVDSYSLTKSGINFVFNVKFKPLGEASGIDTVRERFIALGGFFIMNSYAKEIPLSIAHIPVEMKPIDLNEPLRFSITLKQQLQSNYTLLFTLATLSSTEEQLRYSDTFVFVK